MQLNEKGYYYQRLFGTVSLQKSVRDKLEGVLSPAFILTLLGVRWLVCTFVDRRP